MANVLDFVPFFWVVTTRPLLIYTCCKQEQFTRAAKTMNSETTMFLQKPGFWLQWEVVDYICVFSSCSCLLVVCCQLLVFCVVWLLFFLVVVDFLLL